MARLTFQPALEGLRGLAVLAVLLFHAAPARLPGGFLGVSTFFTLSGFLITSLLVREWEETGQIRFSAFWARRVRRLLPASLLALFGIALVAPALADVTQMERLAGDGISALFYVSNWWLIVTGAAYDQLQGSPSIVQHFWSLSIEEQYYFFYPLFAYAILRASAGSRKPFGLLLALAAVFSWGWMAYLASTEFSVARAYYGTDTRAGELLAGGVLALFLLGRTPIPPGALRSGLIVAGVGGLVVTVCGFFVARVEGRWLYDGGLALYACGTLALIAAAVQTSGPVRMALSWSPIRWLGRISYGAYVYHWPIFLWTDNDVVRWAATLGLADLSYRFLEAPIREGRAIRGRSRLVAPVVSICAVALAFWSTLPEESSLSEVAAAEETTPLSSLERRVRIAVFGDSLAADIGDGLEAWAKQTGKARVRNLAIRGCGIARGAWTEKDRGTSRSKCDTWPNLAYRKLPGFRPDVVVVSTAGSDLRARQLDSWARPRVIGDPEFDRWLVREYARIVQIFRSYGAHVIWLTSPCREHPWGLRTGPFDPVRTRHMNDGVLARLAAGREDGLSIVDLESAICPEGRYARSVHGIKDFRRDGIHLSEPARLWVGSWLGEQILSTVPLRSVRRRRPPTNAADPELRRGGGVVSDASGQ